MRENQTLENPGVEVSKAIGARGLTTPVREVVQTFFGTLGAAHQEAARVDIDSDQWQRPPNIPIYKRQGRAYGEW